MTPLEGGGGIAAFLWRVAAYFQGYLAALPRLARPVEGKLIIADASIDDSSGPVTVMRMNRAFSRRMRWLIKRGRVQPSGKMRLYNPNDEQRCQLNAGQYMEYNIRVHGIPRVRIYGLGFGRLALRLRAIRLRVLQGDRLCLHKAENCAAPLSPD